MASLQEQADAVKAAVISVATCSPATTVLLKGLLLPTDDESPVSTSKNTKGANPSRSTKPKSNSASSKPADASTTTETIPELSAKERALLATHVINAALKSLADAAKASVPATPKKSMAEEEDLQKTATKRRIRRSNSAPVTPMQPRSANQLTASPDTTKKPAKLINHASTGCLSTVECARVAFSALRSLQSTGKITLPELQLEAGMSSLVGKLLNLGLMEHAMKEMRSLKKRLDDIMGPVQKKTAKVTASTSALGISAILDFGTGTAKAFPQLLNLVVTTQLQVLRILAKLKNPRDIEASLPFLRENNKTSPINILASIAGNNETEKTRGARQLDTVSQLLFALTPSTSTSEDETAKERRLSPPPATAFEIQAIALTTRLSWWKLAGHQADVDKEILSPLSKCISAYIRRTPESPLDVYKACHSTFTKIQEQIELQGFEPSKTSKSPSASIYQTLGKLARELGSYTDALSWTEKGKSMMNPGHDSAAKCLSVSALLLAFRLRLAWRYPSQDALVTEVIDGLQGSLRGDSAELDELLDSLVMARKSATYILVGNVADESGKKYSASNDLSERLELFVGQMPRFCLRWLGKRPSAQANTKEFLRFEQRRAALTNSASQVLDSALMLVKTGIDKNRMAWDQLDSLLHECLALLDSLGELPVVDSSHSYYTKISHLYYVQYTGLIAKHPKPVKDDNGFSIALRALRRSIDCVKHRPRKDREKSHLFYKLERVIQLYRDARRFEDALSSLQTLRSILIEDGVLTSVANALKDSPPRKVWSLNEDIKSLSWALQTIAKIEKVWIDWTVHLEEPDRVLALEHRLVFILSKASSGIDISDPSVQALLQLCTIERFPVRRLRVLLRILISNIGYTNRVSSIQLQVEEASCVSEDADLGEDAGLKGSILHMKALSASIMALTSQEPDHTQIAKSLSAWQTLLDSSTVKGELDQRVDDMPGLLEHLQSIADYAKLSNQNGMQLKALKLAFDFTQKTQGIENTLSLDISAALALQLTNLGQSQEARTILDQALDSCPQGFDESRLRFQLSHAQYFIELGNVEKADAVLRIAKESASPDKLTSRSRDHRVTLAQASLVYSAVALARGDGPCALAHARNAARVLFQEWSRIERQTQQDSIEASTTSADDPASKLNTGLTEGTEKEKINVPKISGPEAWKLAHPVIHAMLFLSNIYAHLGMYQETVYYAEQGQGIAKTTNSKAFLIQCNSWMAIICARAGKHEEASKALDELKAYLDGCDSSSKTVSILTRLSSISREVGNLDMAISMLQAAERMLGQIGVVDKILSFETDTLGSELAAKVKSVKSATREKTISATRKGRVATNKASVAKTASKKVTTSKPTSSTVTAAPSEDPHFLSIQASVMIEKASSMLHQKDWTGALQMLQQVRQSPAATSSLLSELIASARSLVGQSIDQMAKDPVYSVIQDSTLSFPSACGTPNSADRFSLAKASPPRMQATTLVPQRASVVTSQGYLENLRQAREYLLEAHTMASVMGDGREVYRTLCMLQTLVIILSAASSSSGKAGILGHPGYATCSVEMARNLTWRREHKALMVEKDSGRAGLEWPEEIRSSEDRRTSLSPVADMVRFQREYIDIIPEEWSVISVSLSDDKHDLCISKLQSGQSPFVIRLPLERAMSRDADTEVFNYQEGRTELLDIIKRANATCHDKRDFTVKGAKTAWWAERTALDLQLRELLDKIEQIWLGGFKGIFSQHQKHPELLSKFQNNFHAILDKHLPSRRQVRGKKSAKASMPKVVLDTRILELFVGLGDTSAEDCDFDDMLNDLLYFVVDILQFHGERNAYDEIDFDAMVVDTIDALHSFHAEAKNLGTKTSQDHTILVLDKALHTFPWECLPCLQGLAVSRVPSLSCLRRLILEQRAATGTLPGGSNEENSRRKGHHVSINSGTYMLNPSSDLKGTQEIFDGPLKTSLSSSWKAIESRAPTETEFEKALTSTDILLYMGHGGGAQYIRNRTIRRLDKCRATALLMGCSSASLADVGDFEVYGLVWSYMLSGCPAVVGTLWDVTDKDIDLYTGRLYEEWGVVKRGTFQSGDTKACGSGKAAVPAGEAATGSTKSAKSSRSSSRKRTAPEESRDHARGTICDYSEASLPEAVARARNSGVCKFKYLNAGAVCVYGIPVYIDRSARSG